MIKQLLALSTLSLAFFGCNMEHREVTLAPDQGAVEQGETEPDRNVTQEIRQKLMADGSLSMQAKNVVITTRDGIVTLKGTVNTEAEKRSIEEKAKTASGARSVNNQLVVSNNGMR